MKQFIVALCFIGAVVAGPPSPECIAGPQLGGKTIKDCCQIPDLLPAEITSKCQAAFGPPGGPPPPPGPAGAPPGGPKGCCMAECAMNETKIMVGGKLDKAVAVKYLSDRMAGDAESVKVVTAALDFCETAAGAKKAEFDEFAKMPGPPGEKCNAISGYMIGCIYGQVYKNCPKEKTGADAACAGIKTFVDKCEFLFPPM